VPTEDNKTTVKIGFNIRPYAIECLKEANKHFEVIVFTAGTRNYANTILDVLDPTGELIQHRLFRDSCVEVLADDNTLFVKDLRIFEGRSLEDIVIVDNAVISFAYQIDNGIPILPFREDKDDVEFLHLMKIMKDISCEKDCRTFIRKAFKIGEIMQTDIDSYVHLYELSDSEDDLDDEDYLDKLAECQKSLAGSLKKRNSDGKQRVKKTKKRLSINRSKKIRSVYVKSNTNLEVNEADSIFQSQKNISQDSIQNFDESLTCSSQSNRVLSKLDEDE